MSNAFIFQSEVEFRLKLPKLSRLVCDNSFLVFDKALDRASPSFKKWRQQFAFSAGVTAGEDLKTLESFVNFVSSHGEKLEKIDSSRGFLVVAGGGSVGDFGAFVASVYRRGVPLLLIPTTWLSAIDSAHGGKTGLNVERKKNQLGTFYPASKVLCAWELLGTQGERRFLEARAEALKISWLGAPSKHHSIVDSFSSKEDFFNAIPLMVSEKWKIVRQDPWEKRGIRQRLNLGHTFGHVLEAAFALPHGEAIAWGLKFALNFSWHKKVLADDGVFEDMTSELDDLLISFRYPPKLSEKQMRTYLLADKKRDSSKSIKFVFIKNFGQSLLSPVSIDELIAEAKRQGFCR